MTKIEWLLSLILLLQIMEVCILIHYKRKEIKFLEKTSFNTFNVAKNTVNFKK